MTAPRTDGLRFLSWNLAMLERSAEAPLLWDETDTEVVVRERILDLSPDIVHFQELPGLVPFVETHTMMPANPRSHSGNLATLVTHDIAKRCSPSVKAVGNFAILTTLQNPGLTVANVHLFAGKGAGPDRLMQLTKVIEASPTRDLLIVGDTNMRVDEAQVFAELGFSGDTPPRPTWDSRRNRFRANMPEFRAYFTRWFAGPGLTVHGVAVHDQPVDYRDHTFHISDHFSLSGTVLLPMAPPG